MPDIVEIFLWIALAIGLLALGVFIVQRIRGESREDLPGSSDYLAHFRQLHEEGRLSDQEFNNIRANLAAKVQQDLRDNPPSVS